MVDEVNIDDKDINLGRWFGRVESKLEENNIMHKQMQENIIRIEKKLDRLEGEVQGMIVANKVKEEMREKEELKQYHFFSRRSDYVIMITALLALVISVLHVGFHGL